MRRLAFVGAFLAASCLARPAEDPSAAAARMAEEEACLVSVDLALEDQAQLLCFGVGMSWAECPDRDELLRQYREDQNKCRR